MIRYMVDKYFPQSTVLTVRTVPFNVQKSCLMQFLFGSSTFPFVACAFGVIPNKLLSNPVSEDFLPMFSSKSFTVLGLESTSS